MKRTLISIAAALGFSIIPSTALLAQSAQGVYNISFSFNAAGVQLPSGRYTISNSGLIGDELMTLGGYGGSVIFMRRSELRGKRGPAHLTFSKYGDSYFLREVWQDDGVGTKIKVNKQEIREEEAKNTAQTALVAAMR